MKKVLTFALCLLIGTLSAMAGNVLVKGKVRDGNGKAVRGAVISDGFGFTQTDRSGRYRLTSDPDKAFCVFVIPSGEYDVPTDGYGKYNGYQFIATKGRRQRCDFTLERVERGRYSVIFQADPQSMSSRPHSGASWEWVADRLHEFGRSFETPVYQIVLGDMVTNEMDVPGMADKFISTFNRIGIRTMFVPGNHDHLVRAKDFRNATSVYTKYFGPYNYAVNIGGVHYIFLDSCAWGETPGKRYTVDFNDETIAFLKGDLAFVPMDTPVMICTHCPLTQTMDGLYPHIYKDVPHYQEFIEAIKGRKVNMWYGHLHINVQNAYTQEELDRYAPGVVSLDSHVVGRVGGAWSCSGEITMDGCPRGVVVADVDGGDVTWHYHGLQPGYPEDFNVYAPGTFGDDLYCNVYLWDEKWETPKWYENGEYAGEMTKCIESNDACNEPLYVKLYSEWVAQGLVDLKVRPEPSKPSYCNHLFRITPSAGVKKGEIRFKDRFGREMSRTVTWE